MSTLLNRKAAKNYALSAAAKRFHEFTRVSPDFLDRIEGVIRTAIEREVHRLPSVGKTIK